MYLCYHGETGGPFSLSEDITAAAAAGFAGLEIAGRKLERYLQEYGAGGLKQALDLHGLRVPAIDYVAVDLNRDEPLEGALRTVREYGPVAQALACDTLLLVVLGRRPELEPEAARNYLAKLMLPLCAAARGYGLRLALEFLGRDPVLPAPAEALEVVTISRQDNLGLSWDMFHSWKSAVPLAALRAIPIERLYVVHAADAPAGDPAMLSDADRVLPGSGRAPLAEYFRVLLELGYDGPVSVEVPNPDLWHEGPEAAAQAAFASLQALVPMPAR